MKRIADLLFEGHMLKRLPRSGYQFLGAGGESVAEHTYVTAFIALVLSRLVPDVDAGRLIAMCLIHDLPESRTGDLNSVQKRYVTADEDTAMADALSGVPFAEEFRSLLDEFNAGETLEAQLARDADQLSFIVDLKSLSDRGYRTPEKWLPYLLDRLQTEPGKTLAREIASRDWDGWWLDNYVDTNG